MIEVDMDEKSLKAYLADNPRMVGVIFTMLMLLAQAGNVSAGYALSCGGP